MPHLTYLRTVPARGDSPRRPAPASYIVVRAIPDAGILAGDSILIVGDRVILQRELSVEILAVAVGGTQP